VLNLIDSSDKEIKGPEADCQVSRSHMNSETIITDLSQILLSFNCPNTFKVIDVMTDKSVYESKGLNKENNGKLKNFFMSNPF
jgi:hypothetical protein